MAIPILNILLNEVYIEEEGRLGSNFYLDNLTRVKWAVVQAECAKLFSNFKEAIAIQTLCTSWLLYESSVFSSLPCV